MGTVHQRLLPLALAVAVLGLTTFMTGDLTGNHRMRAAGAVILGAVVLLSAARWSLGRPILLAHHGLAAKGARVGSGAGSASERRLVIISRDEPAFYEHAVTAFGSAGGTHVLYDRRLGQRRRGGGPTAGTERRRGERRTRADVDAEIKAFGSAIVRLA
jgi:hypothetical protein